MSCICWAIMGLLLLGEFVTDTAVGRVGCAVRCRRRSGVRTVVVMSGRHSGDQRRSAGRHLDAQDRVPRDVFLARTATGPLTRNYRAALEDLAAPDTPRLAPL